MGGILASRGTEFNEFKKLAEFDNHRLLLPIYDRQTGLRAFIAIHRGGLKRPAFGATRFYRYKTLTEALRDALRLSRLMSYKSAMAGLPYGGAKGVILDSAKDGAKNLLLKRYAEQVNYLGGHFVTGADVGISENDIALMREKAPYVVGVKVDPVLFTVLGVFYSLAACLKEVFGSEKVAGKIFAIQGLGKIGMGLAKLLHQQDGSLIVSDIDKKRAMEAVRLLPGTRAVPATEIYRQNADVFMPCALAHSLTPQTVGELRSQIVIGGANNQLSGSDIGETLYRQGILYAPDYIVNAGGLIGVAAEFEDPEVTTTAIKERVRKIKYTLENVLAQSKRKKRAPHSIADEMAEKIIKNFC